MNRIQLYFITFVKKSSCIVLPYLELFVSGGVNPAPWTMRDMKLTNLKTLKSLSRPGPSALLLRLCPDIREKSSSLHS